MVDSLRLHEICVGYDDDVVVVVIVVVVEDAVDG